MQSWLDVQHWPMKVVSETDGTKVYHQLCWVSGELPATWLSVCAPSFMSWLSLGGWGIQPLASREPCWEHGLGCCLCLAMKHILYSAPVRWGRTWAAALTRWASPRLGSRQSSSPCIYWENILRFFDWAHVGNEVVHKMIVSLGRDSHHSNTKKSMGNHYS